MKYLTDVQMSREKPFKDAYTRKNNVMLKYLEQSDQFNGPIKKPSKARSINLLFSHRKNQIIVNT